MNNDAALTVLLQAAKAEGLREAAAICRNCMRDEDSFFEQGRARQRGYNRACEELESVLLDAAEQAVRGGQS